MLILVYQSSAFRQLTDKNMAKRGNSFSFLFGVDQIFFVCLGNFPLCFFLQSIFSLQTKLEFLSYTVHLGNTIVSLGLCNEPSVGVHVFFESHHSQQQAERCKLSKDPESKVQAMRFVLDLFERQPQPGKITKYKRENVSSTWYLVSYLPSV